jgi:hypothetical protein
MKIKWNRTIEQTVFAVSACMWLAGAIRADIIITEVHPSGSGNSTYAADWFELTNTGGAAVDISGWKIDDNTNAFASAVGLRGTTSINPGQSIVFAEGDSTGSNDSAIAAAFISAWFGGNAPAGFAMGGYGGSQVGLSTSGDAVNIYNAGGTLIHNVSFGTATSGRTFDNSAGATGAISLLSTAGVNGAFGSVAGSEVGSPGIVVPEPGGVLLLAAGAGLLAASGARPKRSCT